MVLYTNLIQVEYVPGKWSKCVFWEGVLIEWVGMLAILVMHRGVQLNK